MDIFQDMNGCHVELAYKRGAFDLMATHVLAICKFEQLWVLTKHKKRGFEFPGGKVEKGETLEEAVIREIDEEIGGITKSLKFLGEYKVSGEHQSFVKAIYYVTLDTIIQKEDYFETDGPVLFSGDLNKERFQDQFSFIMKDKIIEKALGKIEN